MHILLDLDEPMPLEKIAATLGTNKTHLSKIIRNMEKLGYVQANADGSVRVLKRSFFLSKDSHLHRAHLTLLRLLGVQHMQKLEPEERQAISVTFSADESTFRKIQEEFMVFFSKYETLARAAPSRKAFQLNFDLFPW